MQDTLTWNISGQQSIKFHYRARYEKFVVPLSLSKECDWFAFALPYHQMKFGLFTQAIRRKANAAESWKVGLADDQTRLVFCNC